LADSKLLAEREKDRLFVAALRTALPLDAGTVLMRLATTDAAAPVVQDARGLWARLTASVIAAATNRKGPGVCPAPLGMK